MERLTEDNDGTIDSGLLECRVVAGAPREWLCAYIPLNVGLYEVRIFTTSGPLPGSPFSVKVSLRIDKCSTSTEGTIKCNQARIALTA